LLYHGCGATLEAITVIEVEDDRRTPGNAADDLGQPAPGTGQVI